MRAGRGLVEVLASPHMHSAIYFTAFGLLTIFHGYRVILLRRKFRVGIGSGGHSELEKMIRVHGNHSEYVPIGLILLIGLEFVQAPNWYLHLCGLTLLAGRLLHAYGLSQSEGLSFGRYRGMQLTFFSLILSSIGVTLWSFVVP